MNRRGSDFQRRSGAGTAMQLLVIVLAGLLFASTAVRAAVAQPAAADPALEARMLELTSELRCLVCQNQTIADSHSGLAEDLRREVREQLRQGASNDDVRRYMTARYGDFVLYRPRFAAHTLLLWIGPALLMLGALVMLVLNLRRRARLDNSAFEADPDESPVPVAADGSTPTAQADAGTSLQRPVSSSNAASGSSR
jgi:cytochrome c-type biogenesis protein CcmH